MIGCSTLPGDGAGRDSRRVSLSPCVIILAILVTAHPQALLSQGDSLSLNPRSGEVRFTPIDTTDDALSGCEIERNLYPDMAFDYGWNLYRVPSRELTSWIGFGFIARIWPSPAVDPRSGFLLTAKIGGGLLYALGELGMRYRFTGGTYFTGGAGFQFFFDPGDLGSYDYGYQPYVERIHLLQNMFMIFGIGFEGEKNFTEFQLRIPMQKSVITPSEGYTMTGEAMKRIPPQRFISLAISWGFQH